MMNEILAQYNNSNISCDAESIINITYPEVVKWMWSDNEKILITIVFPVLVVLGIAANIIFLVTICRRKELHCGLGVYLINLVMCDIILLAGFSKWSLSLYLSSPIRYNVIDISVARCISNPLFIYIWYYGSVGFVTVISFERFLAICKPLQHRFVKGTRRNVKIILSIWSMAAILSSAVIVFYVKPANYCLQILTEDDSESMIIASIHYGKCEPYNEIAVVNFIIISFTSFFVPLCLNCVFYSKIIITLSKRLPAQNKSAADNVRNQVARILVINGIVFFICHMPFRVDAITDNLTDGYERSLDPILLYYYGFLILNSAINPYIYIFGCNHYRHAVFATLKCADQ